MNNTLCYVDLDCLFAGASHDQGKWRVLILVSEHNVQFKINLYGMPAQTKWNMVIANAVTVGACLVIFWEDKDLA